MLVFTLYFPCACDDIRYLFLLVLIAQLQHYIQLGVVPVVEFSAVAASLQSTRWLPHDCDIEASSTSGETDFHLGPLLLRELARGWLRTKIGGTTLLYSLLGSCTLSCCLLHLHRVSIPYIPCVLFWHLCVSSQCFQCG